MMMNQNTPTHSSNVELLLAAIAHLKQQYLAQPDHCLSVMITRYYRLLLAEKSANPDRNTWLTQLQLWSQHCQCDTQTVSSEQLVF